MGRLTACLKEMRNVHNFCFGNVIEKAYVTDLSKNGNIMWRSI